MFDVKFPADSKWDELWENLAACIWPSNVTNEELQESIDWLHKHSEKFKSVSGLLSWQSGQMLLKPAMDQLNDKQRDNMKISLQHDRFIRVQALTTSSLTVFPAPNEDEEEIIKRPTQGQMELVVKASSVFEETNAVLKSASRSLRRALVEKDEFIPKCQDIQRKVYDSIAAWLLDTYDRCKYSPEDDSTNPADLENDDAARQLFEKKLHDIPEYHDDVVKLSTFFTEFENLLLLSHVQDDEKETFMTSEDDSFEGYSGVGNSLNSH